MMVLYRYSPSAPTLSHLSATPNQAMKLIGRVDTSEGDFAKEKNRAAVFWFRGKFIFFFSISSTCSFWEDAMNE